MGVESTLHQISPYLGKIKSSMAAGIISSFTEPNDLIYDPFSGAATIGLEAWMSGRRVITNDLNPYAHLLNKAKLFPSLILEDILEEIEMVHMRVTRDAVAHDLRKVPAWVRSFYHPDTLREILSWVELLRKRKAFFLLANLLGILHHQRPGFLSYPSSHTVPYLRTKKFPKSEFPELYEYRPLRHRLEKKVARTLRRVPNLDFDLKRECHKGNTTTIEIKPKVDAIITSPPYMHQLDYGRDNRLRLWFLGFNDWKTLDMSISPSEKDFLSLLRRSMNLWKHNLRKNGKCILILGDGYCRSYKMKLPDVALRIAAKEIGGYLLAFKHTDPIPDERRVRRGNRGSLTETILVFEKTDTH